jgi:riboflavin synthase
VGTLLELRRGAEGARLRIATALAAELAPGDSIAVNGVCLTAGAPAEGSFCAEAMNETLARSSLGSLAPGDRVNLELALRASDRLGGHIVQGHVDATGTLVALEPDGFARRLCVRAPLEVLRYLAPKGSIALDGVSLTIVGLQERSFTVSLIPETLERTNLGGLEPGATVNLEVDVLAKYVERLIAR